MYRKKVMATGLAVLAIVTAISLVTASSNTGLVTSAFAVKKGGGGKSDTSSSGTSSSSTSKKGTSSTGGTSTGSKSKFIKCVTAISGSPSKAQVDNCWEQVFGGGSGLTLGGSFGSSGGTSGSTLGGGSRTTNSGGASISSSEQSSGAPNS